MLLEPFPGVADVNTCRQHWSGKSESTKSSLHIYIFSFVSINSSWHLLLIQQPILSPREGEWLITIESGWTNCSTKMSPTANGHEHKFKNGGDCIETAIPQVPVTEQRLPFMKADDHGYLQQAGRCYFIKAGVRYWHSSVGAARANIAVSVEAPYGTEKGNWTGRYKNQMVSFLTSDSASTLPYIIYWETPLSPSAALCLPWCR
jgi:hypothetical protein